MLVRFTHGGLRDEVSRSLIIDACCKGINKPGTELENGRYRAFADTFDG